MILKKSVITRLILIITLLCSIIHTKLTIEQIKKEVDKKKIPASSIINPLFGWLFEFTGCLENIRFYSPSLEFGIDKNKKRLYVKDTSTDPFIQSVIMLFPSPTGTLCPTTTAGSNFAKNFSDFKNEGIELLAKLFIAVSRGDKEIDPNFLTGKAKSFKSLAKSLLQNDNISFSDSEKQLRSLLLHAFIVNMLDDPNDLLTYLNMISSVKNVEIQDLDLDMISEVKNVEIQDLDLDMISNVKNVEIQDFNRELFEMVGKARESLNFFPYSQLNPPSSQSLIPVYNRKDDTFDEKTTFSDCVDVMLLHLCNCLFYDNRTKEYSVEHLKKDAPIRKFYKKYSKPFTSTLDIRKEWSKVIQDLPDLEEEDKSIYRTDLILYNKPGRNELYTGIINMMSVLARICSINTKDLWEDLNDSNLGDRLEWLLNELINKEDTTIKVEIPQPSFTKYHPKDERTDFVGNFRVTFKYAKSKSEATILVQQSEYTCYIKFVSGECPAKEELNIPESLINMSEDDLKTALFKRYMLLAKEMEMPCEEYNDTSLFNMIYISGPLSSDKDKCIILDKIYGALLNKGAE